jgi:hypothetical protein
MHHVYTQVRDDRQGGGGGQFSRQQPGMQTGKQTGARQAILAATSLHSGGGIGQYTRAHRVEGQGGGETGDSGPQ